MSKKILFLLIPCGLRLLAMEQSHLDEFSTIKETSKKTRKTKGIELSLLALDPANFVDHEEFPHEESVDQTELATLLDQYKMAITRIRVTLSETNREIANEKDEAKIGELQEQARNLRAQFLDLTHEFTQVHEKLSSATSDHDYSAQLLLFLKKWNEQQAR